MPCSSLLAIQKLPSIQYLIFSAAWSFMIPPPDSNLPVRVCSDEPILETKSQKRGQWWNPAVTKFQFLLRFTTAVSGDPSTSPISPLHDGMYPPHLDHLPAAFTNKSAYCRCIWNLRINFSQAFPFDESQLKPKRFFCPTTDFLLPKVNRPTIPSVSLFHKKHHGNTPVCVSPSW